MARANKTKPLSDVETDFFDSLKAFKQAANMLYTATSSICLLVDNGADPKKAIDELKEHCENFKRAWVGQ